MADFVSPGWGIYIIVVTLVSIAACFWLAWTLASTKTPTAEDGSVDTTGHVWDETLQELNHPLPRWWLYLFYLTCVFSLLYLVLYPGLGEFKGILGWSQEGAYELESEKARATYEPLFEKYLAQDITAVAADTEAIAMGERLYLTYCTQCHGSDARGARSFPNLSDNYWLGTGEPDYIKNTILNGRVSVMPAMAAALGGDEGIENVANYVLSLSDSNHDAEKAANGVAKFAVCAACHGAEGKGNPVIGAPDLTDDNWLYGGSLDSIQEAINNGYNNKMPAFGELLGEGKAHVLAAYIWNLSNGAASQ